MTDKNGSRPIPLDVETAVRERYTEGAKGRVPELCCPVDYDAKYLEVIPPEVIERDYGCGDPSKHLRPGEHVLDLGSGTGKICFIASQVVGPEGSVTGVDVNDEMLAVARRHAPTVAERVGHDNVVFKRGKIQDLQLDLDQVEGWLAKNPVKTSADFLSLESHCDQLRRDRALIASDSMDVVVSNCVLNLVRPEDKTTLFREIFRVLKKGGRAVISDIVSDEDIPEHMQNDEALWSGCISGAFREDSFLEAFEAAGFHGIRIVERGPDPWTTVEGIEFRSVTVEAFKGKHGPCLDRNQAVIYAGPWKEVLDDDGHVLRRGVRTAVCEKTYQLYQKQPYGDQILPVPPRIPIPVEEAPVFDCSDNLVRHPRETKGVGYRETKSGTDCEPGSCC